jgi:hypothetical protein
MGQSIQRLLSEPAREPIGSRETAVVSAAGLPAFFVCWAGAGAYNVAKRNMAGARVKVFFELLYFWAISYYVRWNLITTESSFGG